MGKAIAFYTIAAFILGFAVLVVSTRDTVNPRMKAAMV